jgi:hypothetical protein
MTAKVGEIFSSYHLCQLVKNHGSLNLRSHLLGVM